MMREEFEQGVRDAYEAVTRQAFDRAGYTDMSFKDGEDGDHLVRLMSELLDRYLATS